MGIGEIEVLTKLVGRAIAQVILVATGVGIVSVQLGAAKREVVAKVKACIDRIGQLPVVMGDIWACVHEVVVVDEEWL